MWSSSLVCAIFLVASGVYPAQTAVLAATTQPADDQTLDDATRAKLTRPLSSFQMDKVDFESCLGYLEQTGGVKIVVPWDQVKAAGINRYKGLLLLSTREHWQTP